MMTVTTHSIAVEEEDDDDTSIFQEHETKSEGLLNKHFIVGVH